MYCRHHQLDAGVLVLHATYAMTTQISINLIAMKTAYRIVSQASPFTGGGTKRRGWPVRLRL